jgi:predicted dehydrogenase
MPRVAVIGCGSIGRRHLANLRALGCEVLSYDVSVFAPASTHKAEEFIDRADAWVIATPHDNHLFWAEWAAAKRIPFFTEKPLGSLEQIERWRRLVAAASGLTTQVGYQCRFHPKAQAMRALVPNPVGGDFHCVVDMAQWPGRAYGPLELEASHDLDLALWMGAPVNLAGQTDWRVSIENSPGGYCRSWSVFDDTSEARAVFDSPGELGDQMYVDAMAHFLECVREGKPTICPLADGVRVLEAVEAMACLSSR